jgi:hypothetical protein
MMTLEHMPENVHPIAVLLKTFHEELSPEERLHLKGLLSFSAEKLGLGFYNGKSLAPTELEALNVLRQTFGLLYGPGEVLAQNGIVWRGRAPFMTEPLLKALIEEATAARSEAEDIGGILLEADAVGEAGEVYLKEISRFIQGLGRFRPNEQVVEFIYYETEGRSRKPHVDIEPFSLHVLCMLKHQHEAGQRSHLVLCPPDQEPVKVQLEPGEIVCFLAGSTLHYREPLHQNEGITLLSCGFVIEE